MENVFLQAVGGLKEIIHFKGLIVCLVHTQCSINYSTFINTICIKVLRKDIYQNVNDNVQWVKLYLLLSS